MKKNLVMIIMIVTASLIISALCSWSIWVKYIKYIERQRGETVNKSFSGTLTEKNNYQYDNDFNIKVLKPNISVTARRTINSEVVYDVIYEIDHNAFRFTKSNDKSANKYLFLGCSFMFGEGLNNNETLPYYFSEELKFQSQVINAGYPGTATNVAYTILQSKKMKDILNGEAEYIIYGFIDAHVFRNLAGAHQNFIFKVNDGKLAKISMTKDANLIFSDTIMRKLRKSEAMELTARLIYEMNLISEKYYKAKFVVFFYPDCDKEVLEFMRKELSKNNIAFFESAVDYSKDVSCEYLIKNEGHPTPKANMEYAKEIYDYIMRKKN